MNVNQSIRVGAFFLFGVALLWIVYETLSGNRLDRGDGYRLTATFNDIQQLRPTSEVRMAGVSIGSVLSTRLDGTKAQIEIVVQKGVRIPEDSKASIATAGMLGLNYVAIVPGDGTEVLEAGETIATVEVPDLSSVMAKLDGVGTRLDGVLASAQQIATNIADGKGTIGKLINGPGAYDQLMSMTSDIQGAAKRVSTLMDNTNEMVAHVRSGEGPLGEIIYNEQVADNLKVTVANVREFTSRLNDTESSLGRFISNDSLYRQASNTLTKLDGAINSMNDAGPITAVGVLANALF